MNRTRLLAISTLVWLTCVWVGLWGRISAATVLGGLAVAAAVMLLAPLPRVPVRGRVHPLSLIELIVVILWYAVYSSIQVAWLAVRPKAPPTAGVLRVRTKIKSDMVLVLFADVVNLTPGTMVLEIDLLHRSLHVHVLDLSDDHAVTAFHRSTRRLEQLFVDAFERESEWQGSGSATRSGAEA
jgi:multicomponent Na+:H+ antiporter subunit E